MIESIPLPALLAVPTVFGPLTSWLAARRRRSSVAWFMFGAILGPIALALLLAAPLGTCEICNTPTRGWSRQCETCGASLRAGDTERVWSAFAMERPWPATPGRAQEWTRATRGGQPAEPPQRAGVRTDDGREVPRTAADGARNRRKVPRRVPGVAPSGERPEGRSGPRPEARPGARREAPPVGRGAAASGSTGRPPAGPAPRQRGAQRPGPGSPPAPASVLASGVCIGGVAGLIIGARYVVNREGGDLVIFGPVDLPNGSSVVRASLTTVDITLFEDQLLITRLSGGRSGLLAAFRSVAAYYGVDIEHEIALGREAARDAG